MDYINVVPRMEVAVEATWSGEIAPWRDEFEGFVRQQTPQHRTFYRHLPLPASPRSEPTIRRRLRPEDSCVKSHQTFSMTAMPAGELRERRDTSELSSSCSPVTHVTSTTSLASTPWSTSSRVEEIFEDDEGHNWEGAELHHQGVNGVSPKLEPIDEVDMDDLYEVEDTPMKTSTAQASPVGDSNKRPRGRPRKNPKPDPEAKAKVHKGRSKTGCGTCRRRKKKCDEAKPICE